MDRNRKYDITENDMMRVENKLNNALNERLASRMQDITKDKIKSLHNFLEDIEKEDNHRPSVAKEPKRFDHQTNIENKEKEYLQNLTQTKGVIKSLKIELDETKNNLQAVKQLMEDERAKYMRKEKELIGLMSEKDKEYTTEIQNSLTRQQDTIEQLLIDKRNLSEQVGSLMKQLKLLDDKNNRVLQELKGKFRKDIKEAKEAWMAVEKNKRDKWKAEKEKEIKEGTLRGLEPEIEAILSKSREEKRKLQEEMADKVKVEKMKIEEEYMDRLSEFKRKVIEENESILKKEKEHIQGTYQQWLKEANKISEDKLTDLNKKYQKELEEAGIKKTRETEYYEDRIMKIQKENLEEIAKLKRNFEADREELKAKYDYECKRVKSNLTEGEKEIKIKLEEEIKAKYQEKLEKERNSIIKERDEQIQMIVEKLLLEKAEAIEREVLKERSRIKETKDRVSEQVEEIKMELTVYKEKLMEEKHITNRLENDIISKERRIDGLIRENEEEREKIIKMKTKLKLLEENYEKDRLTFAAKEKSLKEQLEAEQTRAIKGRDEIFDVEVRYKKEKDMALKDLEEKHVEELEALEKRIKVILFKKENEISELKQELDIKESLCHKYEDLLERQRRDIISNIK